MNDFRREAINKLYEMGRGYATELIFIGKEAKSAEMVDSGLMHFKSGTLSNQYQGLAMDLEEKINRRVDDKTLRKQGFLYDSEAAALLDPKLKQRPDVSEVVARGIVREEYLDKDRDEVEEGMRENVKNVKNMLEQHHAKRPSIGTMQRKNLVPHGAFEDVEEAQKLKHARLASLQDELNFHLENQPDKAELIEKGLFQMAETETKRRKSWDMNDDDDEDEDAVVDGNDSGYNSPSIPPVPDRPSAIGASYAEVVMNSIQYHNKKVIEPVYQVDVLVAEPELDDDTIHSSTLSFLNVSDSLSSLIERKISIANVKYINLMKSKSVDLQKYKNFLRCLQQYGLKIVDLMEENEEFLDISFESCGDVEKDIDSVMNRINTAQVELFKLDEQYVPLHYEIKKIQNKQHELEEYSDEYKIQLSQLKRVRDRISSYIVEHEMVRDSSTEAIRATSTQQGWMISKITNKIVKTQNKIDSIESDIANNDNNVVNNEELCDELLTCQNFLNGLQEFLRGLKKLRKSSQDKIDHLEVVISELLQQRNEIDENIVNLRREAINKLYEMREFIQSFSNGNDVNGGGDDDSVVSELEDDNDDDRKNNNDNDDDDDMDLDDSDLDDSEMMDFNNSAPLSMLELMHRREKYMSKVYKKIHDLESRAMTTSSTDYLRGLTEIRELQMILSNRELKYFYNHFVVNCNQMFNDCSLAHQALLEKTAEINSDIITNLKGIQLLTDVLTKNQRKLQLTNTQIYLETIVNFIHSLPDREVVIMQIARHLSLSLPFRSFIMGQDKRKKEKEKRRRRRAQESNNVDDLDGDGDNDDDDDNKDNENHLIKIDRFIENKIREWMGSILNIYGNNQFSSIRVALDNDVVAQVRPSKAARLIVNCVYGLDVSI